MALSAVLVAALTACGGESSSDAGNAGGGRQNGDSLEGHEEEAPVVLTAAQLQTALSGHEGIPEDWGGPSSNIYEGEKAATFCELDARTGCAGLTAMAMRTLENQTLEELKASVDGQTLFVKAYSFDSEANAAVTVKAMAAAEHKEYPKAKTLKITTAAQYTEATSEEISEGDYSATVFMRTGSVVVTLWGTDLKSTADMQPIAKSRLDRVVEVAAGKNPDA
ncbi:hypothetical protein [Streptomyces sp. NBC_01022]|uniref:hypothetical protein n=1 Tax=Streptomyces sp. NBC_01022 TaxID=2903723 RepID=UPI002DD85309|nr:hypothetical protein [Streptomyces sp. NBC_01022]WRZ84110.1 hypothetical protein OG316_29545 [Streptomyces sp. NBC_01022]